MRVSSCFWWFHSWYFGLDLEFRVWDSIERDVSDMMGFWLVLELKAEHQVLLFDNISNIIPGVWSHSAEHQMSQSLKSSRCSRTCSSTPQRTAPQLLMELVPKLQVELSITHQSKNEIPGYCTIKTRVCMSKKTKLNKNIVHHWDITIV